MASSIWRLMTSSMVTVGITQVTSIRIALRCCPWGSISGFNLCQFFQNLLPPALYGRRPISEQKLDLLHQFVFNPSKLAAHMKQYIHAIGLHSHGCLRVDKPAKYCFDQLVAIS